MSINDKEIKPESLTERSQFSRLFTNRHKSIRLFCEYLNDEPAKGKVLFFHGDGGNGKTWLLNNLRENYCKRLITSRWEIVKELPDDDPEEYFEPNIKDTKEFFVVPNALLDFADRAALNHNPKDYYLGLLQMRRELAKYNIKFPTFDYAIVWYLASKGELTADKLKSLLPSEALDIIGEVFSVAGESWFGTALKVVVSLIDRDAKEKFTLYRQKLGLDKETVQQIQALDLDREFQKFLPKYFAKDLNSAVSKLDSKRIVLFFDTHEAFWGEQRQEPNAAFYQADEWIRILIRCSDVEKGIIFVFSGRYQPLWAKAEVAPISEDYIDLLRIGFLNRTYGTRYLQLGGIVDESLRNALLDAASIEADSVHPFFLGLCGDIYIAAKQNDVELTAKDFRQETVSADVDTALQEKGEILINRLLSLVNADRQYAVKAMSACRGFNADLFYEMGQALKFNAQRADFDLLTEFTFVWNLEKEAQGTYQIHSLLRRLFRESIDNFVLETHKFLLFYYGKQFEEGNALAVADVIYHLNRLEYFNADNDNDLSIGKASRKLWTETFDDALRLTKFDLCRALLDVGGELFINDAFDSARFSESKAEYYSRLSLYREAFAEYALSIKDYDTALITAAEKEIVFNNKGNVLQRLGALQARLTETKEAKESYQSAIEAYDNALRFAPEDNEVFNNKGNVLQRLGALQARLTETEEAKESYQSAIKAYDNALRLAPEDVYAFNNKGSVLARLGDLQARLSETEKAKES